MNNALRLLLVIYSAFVTAQSFAAVEGTLAWSFQAGASVLEPPAFGVDGRLWVASQDRNVYVLTAGAGSLVRTHSFTGTPGPVTLSPVVACCPGYAYVAYVQEQGIL